MKEKIDFKYDDGSKIFLTSDSHWNHENIIRFCNRPFTSLEEMDKALIDNWNNKVPKDGLVFHLGDFAWGGYNVWKNVREQLNGNIILVKGNHDDKNLTPTAEKELFDFATYQLKLEIEGRKIYLNHYPFLCYCGTYREKDQLIFQAYGHVHSGPFQEKGKDNERCKIAFPTQYDVGVDNNDFTPISWYELNEKILNQVERYGK